MMRSLMLSLGLCATAAGAEVPRVAVDIAPVHSIVSAVMGDLGQPDLIVPPGASPHGYALRPSEAAALDAADVVIWMGPKLASWMADPIESLAGDAMVIDLLGRPETRLLEVRDGATFGAHDHGHEEGHDDHADADNHKEHADHDDHDGDKAHADHAKDNGHGDHDGHDDHENHADADKHDDHDGQGGAVDPHAWLDPENAISWATVIADQLAALDPENAGVYVDNAAAFAININTLSDDIEAIVAPVRGRDFVVFHDAYHYFEHRFEIEAAGAVSSNDAVSPSPARLSALRDEIADLGAVCALTEPQFNPGILNALGDVRLGELDPIGVALQPGAKLYSQLLMNMTTSLSNCLK